MRGAKYFGKPCRKCAGTEKYVAQNRCVPCLNRASKTYIENHPDRRKKINTASSRRQYQENPEYRRKKRILNEQWRKANPEQSLTHARASMRKWRQTDPEHAARVLREWRRANPEKERLKNHNRRGRIREAEGICSEEQLLARIAYYGNLCAYCTLRPFEHIDHVIPLSRGGSNWPANLRPACKVCNQSKSARKLSEWKPQSSVNQPEGSSS